MVELKVTVKTSSPIFPGGMKPYGHFLESYTYVPGSLLRGAAAEILLEGCLEKKYREDHSSCPQKEECEFYNVIGDLQQEGTLFPNCYPSNETLSLPRILPATARACKRFSGFLSKFQQNNGNRKDTEEKHGVFDILLNQIVYEEMCTQAIKEKRYIPFVLPLRCPNCKERIERVEPYSVFYVKYGKGKYNKTEVRTRRITRAAINRSRETAEEGMLYSVEVIDEAQSFVGRTFIKERLIDLFKKTMARVTYLGGGQSRGFGRVKIGVEEVDSSTESAVKERIQRFNEKLREIWIEQSQLYNNMPAKPGHHYFSIGLQSDVILKTESGVSITGLSVVILKRELRKLGLDLASEIELVRSYTSPIYLSGWSTAWGLPKRVWLGTRKGSVFVYKVKEIQGLYDALNKLEKRSIGERREEGFGRILICDPFHLEVMPV